VAERLRAHVASMSIPVDDDDETSGHIRLTISVGVASLDGESRELTDLLPPPTRPSHAKETGRNKTHNVSAGLRTFRRCLTVTCRWAGRLHSLTTTHGRARCRARWP